MTSSEEHDGVERSEEEEELEDLDTLPGWTGWMSTKRFSCQDGLDGYSFKEYSLKSLSLSFPFFTKILHNSRTWRLIISFRGIGIDSNQNLGIVLHW